MTSLQSLWFLPQRRLIMAKPSKNRTRKIVDVKAVAANDTQPAVEAPVAETPAATKVVHAAPPQPTSTTATGLGAYYAGLAGRPSKPSVIYVFTKTGYALSWVQRAVRLGITPEELCEQFRTDAEGLKARWAALTAKKA